MIFMGLKMISGKTLKNYQKDLPNNVQFCRFSLLHLELFTLIPGHWELRMQGYMEFRLRGQGKEKGPG